MVELSSINWVEWFGYCASLVVLISLTMSSIIKLRLINFIGCLLFAAFAYFINSWPTMVMNLGIAIINIYFLYKIYSTKEEFKIVSTSIDSEYLRHFISNNEVEITKQISLDQLYQANRVFYMLRNDNIAGVLIGDLNENGCFDIYLDYVVPKFRDYKLGTYYFKTNQHFLQKRGVRVLKAVANHYMHRDYLMKMGFTVDERKELHFSKRLQV
ncbi:YgjV family protein [Psychromonas sp. SP041]|uniref:YgjV family protein n=1 Tax=Psychromonas sp. SP041 TaxID=1365007 RepID=UPI0010C7ADF6|nr:YgjV family protein [Psychromonas sp. SP041]